MVPAAALDACLIAPGLNAVTTGVAAPAGNALLARRACLVSASRPVAVTAPARSAARMAQAALAAPAQRGRPVKTDSVWMGDARRTAPARIADLTAVGGVAALARRARHARTASASRTTALKTAQGSSVDLTAAAVRVGPVRASRRVYRASARRCPPAPPRARVRSVVTTDATGYAGRACRLASATARASAMTRRVASHRAQARSVAMTGAGARAGLARTVVSVCLAVVTRGGNPCQRLATPLPVIPPEAACSARPVLPLTTGSAAHCPTPKAPPPVAAGQGRSRSVRGPWQFSC